MRSQKQHEATLRNHKIRSLHALSGLGKGLLNPLRQQELNRLIDEQLLEIGAAPMGYRWDNKEKTRYVKIGYELEHYRA